MRWRERPKGFFATHHLKGLESACAYDLFVEGHPFNRPRVLDGRTLRCGRPRALVGNAEGRCPNTQAAFSLASCVKVPQGLWASEVNIQDRGEDALVVVLVP